MTFKAITTDCETIAYRDGKRYLWLLSFIPPLVPLVSFWVYFKTESPLATLIPFLFVFGFIPAADALFGEDRHNPPSEVVAAMERDPYYLRLTRASVPLMWLCFISTVAFVGTLGPPSSFTGGHRSCPHDSARSPSSSCRLPRLSGRPATRRRPGRCSARTRRIAA